MSIERRNSLSIKAINESFAKLLMEKSFSKITTTEICERADVSRSTFYANYEDEFDLKDKLMNELISKSTSMLDELGADKDNETIFEGFLSYIKENRILFDPFILNQEYREFKTRMMKIISDKIFKLSGRQLKSEASFYDEMFRLYTIVGGFTAIVLWIQRGYDIDTHECARRIVAYTKNAIMTSKQLD